MSELDATEQKAHILVVDDVASVRQALREGLTQEGYTVTEASDKSTLMARIEQEYANRTAAEIRRTYYRVRKAGNGFEFYVHNQLLR